MQEMALRRKGILPPLPTCQTCGATLKVGSGNGKAYQLGLCYKCYRKTPAYREPSIQQKRLARKATLVSDLWPVGYFSAKPGEELVKHDRLRTAIGYAYVGRGKENGPVFIVWNDGHVTEHYGLKAHDKGITPDHPSATELPPDNPGWFLERIPKEKQSWFES